VIASTVSGAREDLRSSIILPTVLKVASEETVETGITRISLAKRAKTGKLDWWSPVLSPVLDSADLRAGDGATPRATGKVRGWDWGRSMDR